MTTNLDARLNAVSPAVISLFRIVFGLLYTIHGAQKLFAWPVGMPDKAGDLVGSAVPVGTWPYWYGGLIEFVLGLLILTGLFTRIAAFFASGEMAFAYFTQHQPKGLLPIENGGELAVLYCFGFFLLVFIGGGTYALDAIRSRR
ncbi:MULTISPECIES: DoxX family protein [unclassified Mycolicibacterium]|uniref:DoxX family protein n=1 Tax=unclassified Mycolicibacterium TaxID=2636767 RepID=UPI002ED9445D